MRRTLLTGLAVVALLLSAAGGRHAGAVTLAPASLRDFNPVVIQRVANVCGANGCVRVQTERVRHQKPGSVAGHHI
jgi:hypothetical protein